MELIKANQTDFGRITAFYRYVIDHTEHMDEYCRWIYGKHPSDELIRSYLDSGNMYYPEENGAMIGAAAVTFNQEEDYHPVPWRVEAQDNQVAVIHLLCSDPLQKRSGIAAGMVKEIIKMAEMKRMKAIRLDALSCNIPAHRLYESLGFYKCGIQNWYACNIGSKIDFCMYEFNLQASGGAEQCV